MMSKRSFAWVAMLGILAGSLPLFAARPDDRSAISAVYSFYNQSVMFQNFTAVRAFWAKSVSPGYVEKYPNGPSRDRAKAEAADLDLIAHMKVVNQLDYRIKTFRSNKNQATLDVFDDNNVILFSDKRKKHALTMQRTTRDVWTKIHNRWILKSRDVLKSAMMLDGKLADSEKLARAMKK